MVDTGALKSGDFGSALGISGFSFGTIGTVFLWVGIFLVIALVLGLSVWVIYSRRLYTKKIWVFRRIGGVPVFQYEDKGRLMSFGMAGDKLMNLKKTKKFLPPPTIQMGRELFWYWEREDGEFINFSMTDIDEVQRKAGAYFVDTDMRMQRLGIEKNLRERMERKGFFEKYGSTIAGVIFVIMVTVALVVLFSNLKDVASSMDSMAGSVNSMATEIRSFYEERNNLRPQEGGSEGLIPALLPLILLRRKNRKKGGST